jgi:hypothetical protein
LLIPTDYLTTPTSSTLPATSNLISDYSVMIELNWRKLEAQANFNYVCKDFARDVKSEPLRASSAGRPAIGRISAKSISRSHQILVVQQTHEACDWSLPSPTGDG